MATLVIIGNGFDLAHGYKTSYEHFVDHLIKNKADTKLFKHNFRNQFPDLVSIKTKITRFSNPSIIRDYFNNDLLCSLLSNIRLRNWGDIEETYYEILNNIAINSKKPETTKESTSIALEKLNNDFKELQDELEEYLAKETKEEHIIEDFWNGISSNDRYWCILNFNYTNTLHNYNLGNAKKIHIHGKIGDEDNSIIFGYAPTEVESRNLSTLHNNHEFLRYIKMQMYKLRPAEKTFNEFLDSNDSDITMTGIRVKIIGHSCGLSDRQILHTIFTHKDVRSIQLYYYPNSENFRQTQANIYNIIGSDKLFKERFNPFNKDLLTKQYKMED